MVAVVTGAGSGIGRGIAVALAKRGVTIWLVGRTRGRLEETRAMIGSGEVYPMDVADSEAGGEFSKLVTNTEPRWLIHSAGEMPVGALHKAAKPDNAIRANLIGPLDLTHRLLEQAPRCIPVFILSDTVFSAMPGAAVYAASKRALCAYIRQQPAWPAVEVFPPITRTAMTAPFTASMPCLSCWLASPAEVGECIVSELLRGKRSIRLSLASKSALFRGIYRKMLRFSR